MQFMTKSIFLVCAFFFHHFLLGAGDMPATDERLFSMLAENEMAAFEEQISYFFGVSDKQPVAKAYMLALKRLEEIGINSPSEAIEEEVVPYLEAAYREVAAQRNWQFDAHQAARIELQIILGNASGASFESIKNLMSEHYTLVFASDSPNIPKAAMLRTFLYQYKVDALNKERNISPEDKKLMLALAKTSAQYLNSIK